MDETLEISRISRQTWEMMRVWIRDLSFMELEVGEEEEDEHWEEDIEDADLSGGIAILSLSLVTKSLAREGL